MQTMSRNGMGVVGLPAASTGVESVEHLRADDEAVSMEIEQLLPIPPAYAELAERMGDAGLRLRLLTEAERIAVISARERRLPLLANGGWKRLLLRYGLALTGLYARGYRNFLDVQITRHALPLAQLPAAFDGFRILHLSDLHIDMDPALGPVVQEVIAREEYDLIVMTGDYRASVIGSIEETVEGVLPLVHAAKAPVYAVLGNHDFLAMVPPLEAAGVRFLMNETVALARAGQTIFLSGVDDAALYGTDDVPRAAATVPRDAVSLLLSHTPDLYLTAAAHGYDFMLSGHTHAGQICLPGGRVLQRNAYAPDHMLSGAWRFRNLRGYTSAGVGATGVPIRFACPPEAAIHTLVRG